MATAAAPRRGKFLSAPAPSSQSSSSPSASNFPPLTSQTRGKFFGNATGTSAPNSNSISIGSSAGDSNHESIENIRAIVHNSKISAASRRKQLAAQRQSVISDLDEAENIVLSLLDIASDVTGALSAMTVAKSKKQHEGHETKEDGSLNESFEDLTAMVRSNGIGYTAGVNRLHGLLAPHATYVKSLNKRSEEKNVDDDEEGYSHTHGALSSSNSAFSNIIKEATSNMHAIRVKKRLATEKCEILKEMIRQEESNKITHKIEEVSLNTDTTGLKRKREPIEH